MSTELRKDHVGIIQDGRPASCVSLFAGSIVVHQKYIRCVRINQQHSMKMPLLSSETLIAAAGHDADWRTMNRRERGEHTSRDREQQNRHDDVE